MKKEMIAGLLALSLPLSLTACGALADGNTPAEDDNIITIAATTYPVYTLLETLTAPMEQVEVSLVVDQQVSCLHDYTLSVDDMRTLESADVIVINGAGLEAFMTDALSTVDAPVIDCSQGIELLPITTIPTSGWIPTAICK